MACCGGRKLPEQGRRLGVKRAGPTAPGQHSARPGQAVRAEQSTAASVPQRGMVSVAAGNEQKGPEQKNFDSPG